MAKGMTHDRFNFLIGAIMTVSVYGWGLQWQAVIGFACGWLLSTYILSPDLDIMPKKRTGILQFVLYPYSILFKHRGWSHSLLFGTFTRVFYGLVVFFVFVHVAFKMGHIEKGPERYAEFILKLYENR